MVKPVKPPRRLRRAHEESLSTPGVHTSMKACVGQNSFSAGDVVEYHDGRIGRVIFHYGQLATPPCTLLKIFNKLRDYSYEETEHEVSVSVALLKRPCIYGGDGAVKRIVFYPSATEIRYFDLMK